MSSVTLICSILNGILGCILGSVLYDVIKCTIMGHKIPKYAVVVLMTAQTLIVISTLMVFNYG